METPLRLYSRAQYTNSTNDGGVKQIINRNNILYAVVGVEPLYLSDERK